MKKIKQKDSSIVLPVEKGMNMIINILGTEYEIIEQSASENPKLESSNAICEIYAHKIILNADVKNDEMAYDNFQAFKDRVLRHEIIHAFFAESGLRGNSEYAENEELVDWIAIQLPKINEVLEYIAKELNKELKGENK